MDSSRSVAASLSPANKKHLAIQALARTEPISHVATRQQVSRQFLHRQKRKADMALDQAFAPAQKDSEVLFYLPATEAWISQLVLWNCCGICSTGPSPWERSTIGWRRPPKAWFNLPLKRVTLFAAIN